MPQTIEGLKSNTRAVTGLPELPASSVEIEGNGRMGKYMDHAHYRIWDALLVRGKWYLNGNYSPLYAGGRKSGSTAAPTTIKYHGRLYQRTAVRISYPGELVSSSIRREYNTFVEHFAVTTLHEAFSKAFAAFDKATFAKYGNHVADVVGVGEQIQTITKHLKDWADDLDQG